MGMEMEKSGDEREPEYGCRLLEVRFDGLLGNEKQLVLNLEPDGTILTGQNGSGKSTILRAIACAQSDQTWHEFANLPLDSMSLRFEDDMRISFTKDGTRVVLSDDSGGGAKWEVPEPIDEVDSDVRAFRDLALNARSRAEREHFLIKARDAVRRQSLAAEVEHADQSDEPDDGAAVLPDWAGALVARLRVKLVAASRLEGFGAGEYPLGAPPGAGWRARRRFERSERPKLAVDQISEELGNSIRDNSSEIGFEAKKLYTRLRKHAIVALDDARILNQSPAVEEGRAELKAEVDELRDEAVAFSASLAELGVIEEDDAVIASHEAEDAQAEIDTLMVLREIYRGELDALDRLRDLERNLRLFMEFVNERFNAKRVLIVGFDGFRVVLGNGDDIQPSDLSSGEQHLLVLAYDLLFRTPSGSLVLIDEPELSLHVAWLQNLFTAFLEIGDQRDLQFIIATHSPAISVGYNENQRSIDRLLS
jgi:ABC-type lipoprotein export system ATPase subunit